MPAAGIEADEDEAGDVAADIALRCRVDGFARAAHHLGLPSSRCLSLRPLALAAHAFAHFHTIDALLPMARDLFPPRLKLRMLRVQRENGHICPWPHDKLVEQAVLEKRGARTIQNEVHVYEDHVLYLEHHELWLLALTRAEWELRVVAYDSKEEKIEGSPTPPPSGSACAASAGSGGCRVIDEGWRGPIRALWGQWSGKTVAIAIALLSATTTWTGVALAAATATTFHDAAGRVTGKARTEDGTTTYYDAAGRVVGKARSTHH